MTSISTREYIRQAMQLQQGGELERAKSIYAEILQSSPGHADALHLYGLVCHQQGDHETAVRYIHQAVEQVPDQAVLRNNLGDALREAGDYEEAIKQLEIALELRPDYAGACQNLGTAYSQRGEYDAALQYARRAVQMDTGSPGAWYNLGLLLLDFVLLDEAAGAFRKALALRPGYRLAATSLLYTLNLTPGLSAGSVAEEHIAVATTVFPRGQAVPLPAYNNDRIRVGYVSGDFRAHAVNYFFEPLLACHDKSRFESYCYADVGEPDDVSHRLQHQASHWRDISAWDDERLFEQLRADRIDILVDLAGHTRHNRLAVFARKPAACQVSWLGFPNTTGLDSVDYRVVDQNTAAGGEAQAGSEKLLKLPRGFACFRPPAHAPAVHKAPLLDKGFVTLGCLHKLEKLNGNVIELWAEILRENPHSRLLLARDQLDDWQQQRIQTLFQQHAISADRLEMIHFSVGKQSFFELFADIDILLDTFPWSGHTLACCALWMGVPVVSLYGDSHAGRMVASVLKLLELDELVADDSESYARIVGGLCNKPDQLLRYRRELRARFENSPLRDEKGFTRDMETEFFRILKL